MNHQNQPNETTTGFAQAKDLKHNLIDIISTYFRYTKIVPSTLNFHKIHISEFILLIQLNFKLNHSL